jgi:RHS repeat-associated protein
VRGNRTTPAATYDAQDRQTSLGATAITVDDDGFLTQRGADHFTYTASGELAQATAAGQTVSYAYDAAGRRVARIQNGQRTTYLYGDRERPLLVTGIRTPDGTLTTLRYDADDLLVELERGGQRYYVGTDQVGTAKVVTRQDGTVVLTRDYDSFGRLQGSTGTFDLPIGFAGGLDDPVTGLVRFGARDYDPATGRWTARDPLLFDGGSVNLYTYADDDPIGARDLDGRDWPTWEGVKTSAAAGWESTKTWTSNNWETVVDKFNSLEIDNELGKASKWFKDGYDKLKTAEEVADTGLEIKEALDDKTGPKAEVRQARGIFKACTKWLDKLLPVNFTPSELVNETLDRGWDPMERQGRTGSIHQSEQSQVLNDNYNPG